jgi:hypothetical protein
MTNAYLEFIEKFCKLSPFDLNHLSENLLCNIEQIFEEKLCGCNSKTSLSEKELKFAITETMRDIMLELRQRNILNEHLKLDETKAMIFSSRKTLV